MFNFFKKKKEKKEEIIITEELLKKRPYSNEEIQYFNNLLQEEREITKLIERCIKDGRIISINLIRKLFYYTDFLQTEELQDRLCDIAIQSGNPWICYNIACCYLTLKQKERIGWALVKSVNPLNCERYLETLNLNGLSDELITALKKITGQI